MNNLSGLALQNLGIGYKSARRTVRVVSENITVKLELGELTCLLGPNGAGKSTLMRTISGIQQPLSGEVLLAGENVHTLSARELAKRLSVVLTERISVNMLTAYELVALGRHPHTNWTGKLTAKDHEIIQQTLNITGAAELAQRNVSELSDGERQKVMVARALAQEPQVMILDEITAFLDLPRRVEIMQLLRDLSHNENRAVLLSTHDLDLALRTADQIWLLPKGGDLQTGLPEDLVLSGAFAEAFRGEGVEFDIRAGAFKVNRRQEKAIEIGISGAEIPALWTVRALEREGFEANRTAHTANGKSHVQIGADGDRTLWKLTSAGQTRGFNSLAGLIAALKRQSNESKSE